MSNKTKERIEKYLALAKSATPGPWEFGTTVIPVPACKVYASPPSYAHVADCSNIWATNDADFIAASRTDGPWAAEMFYYALSFIQHIASQVTPEAEGEELDVHTATKAYEAIVRDARKVLKELENE